MLGGPGRSAVSASDLRMLAKALEGVVPNQITRTGENLGDVAYMCPARSRGTEGLYERAYL